MIGWQADPPRHCIFQDNILTSQNVVHHVSIAPTHLFSGAALRAADGEASNASGIGTSGRACRRNDDASASVSLQKINSVGMGLGMKLQNGIISARLSEHRPRDSQRRQNNIGVWDTGTCHRGTYIPTITVLNLSDNPGVRAMPLDSSSNGRQQFGSVLHQHLQKNRQLASKRQVQTRHTLT